MRISNFSIFFINVCLLIIIVITCTTIKINQEHEEKMLYAMKTKIEYNAKRCYLEDKCHDEVTLDDLYQLNYLSEVVNPVTKEILDKNIKINYIDNKIIVKY